jgi:hypothetical protein
VFSVYLFQASCYLSGIQLATEQFWISEDISELLTFQMAAFEM